MRDPAPHLTYGMADIPGYFCVCVHSDNGDVLTASFDRNVALALQAALLQFIDIEEERERG